MLLGLLAIDPSGFRLVPYHAVSDLLLSRVRLRRTKGRYGDVARVIVDGHDVGEAQADAQVGLCPCYVPGGIAGNAYWIADGAYLASGYLGFASWRGRVRSFGFRTPAGVARDGTVLFTGTDEWPFEQVSHPGSATLVREGREIAVGPAESASILPNGTVVGYALRRADGAYCGGLNEPEDAHPEAFRWRAGKRTTLGRFYVLSIEPTGDLLGATLPEGRHDIDDAPQSLFVLKGGRRQAIPIGGTAVRGPYHLRDDGSVVFTLGRNGQAATGLGLWQRGRTFERIGPSAPKAALDWDNAEVDRQSRIVVKDEDGHSWQVVRR